jgi:hypothetical protein
MGRAPLLQGAFVAHKKVGGCLEDLQARLDFNVVPWPVYQHKRVAGVRHWVPLCPAKLHQAPAVSRRERRVLQSS